MMMQLSFVPDSSVCRSGSSATPYSVQRLVLVLGRRNSALFYALDANAVGFTAGIVKNTSTHCNIQSLGNRNEAFSSVPTDGTVESIVVELVAGTLNGLRVNPDI